MLLAGVGGRRVFVKVVTPSCPAPGGGKAGLSSVGGGGGTENVTGGVVASGTLFEEIMTSSFSPFSTGWRDLNGGAALGTVIANVAVQVSLVTRRCDPASM